METAPAPSARIGMFMPSSPPKLRGRENLAIFLERFYTWASVTGCDSALDSELAIKTSGTPRAELERLYYRALVDSSLHVWQSLTKALEREQEVMKMVMEIGPPSVAWRALKKMADEAEDDTHDRAKREFETLQMGNSESVSEYFARVNIILMKLEIYNITTSAREIKRVVMISLIPRFPNETSVLAMRGDFDVAELELGLIRVEKHRSESSRSALSHALAVAHAGNGQTGTTGTGGGTRGRGRKGRRLGGRHDDGGGRHQQRNRCTSDSSSSTSHPRRCHNSRTHGSSSSSNSSSTSRHFHKDRTTTSSEEERTTSAHHDIGEDIRLTSSA